MTPEYTNQLATELLLSGLATVFMVGSLGVFLVLICLRGQRPVPFSSRLSRGPATVSPASLYLPSVFESHCRWVAIRSKHVAAVQAALRLHNATPCSFCDGVCQLSQRKLFVSPPVRGWILVIGPGLPEPSDDVDCCFHFLTRLSRAVGQVQFFSVNRALNHHAWVLVDRGQVRRAYAWAGETLWNQGRCTDAERQLGMSCLEYGEQPAPTLGLATESHIPNAEKVTMLAGRWSFDPSTIEQSLLRAGLGITGEVCASRPH